MLTTKLWLGTPRLFLTGSAMVTAGVLLHLPMFISARDMHYQMNGMPWDAQMVIGMVLIAVGSILALGGLIKPSSGPRKSLARMRISAEDDDKTARLGAAHYKLIAVMIFAIAIDTQKPFTLTFIIPSAAKEYALSTPAHLIAGAPTVAWLPFTGILGTTIGSFLWGYLGDRIGRRSSLLFAAVMFVGTSVCGAMPSYGWNVAMCLLMGIGAGGMLPAAYTLLAETTPARLRGAVLVLVGGVGTALGFLFASWMATWLLPILGWRVLWFAGMPTGILLLACSRLVPESPRFLLLHDRTAEATAVLRRFGQRLITVDDEAAAGAQDVGADDDRRAPAGSFGRLFQRPFGPVTAGLVICGLAWGMVNFGFLTWLPSTIGSIGISATQITGLLAKAALFAVPGALAVAWLYARWSTRRTMVVSALITGAT
ncbi:MAG: MFS transporter, partial [Sciscionella sp.]|nr:MFS transporter [Sciscionella sp.]